MNSKTLKQLLDSIQVLQVEGNLDKNILDITCDSRTMKPGSMFIAVRGVSVDAHKFLPQVAETGATAVVCEEFPQQMNPAVTYVRVADSTIALAHLASAWYDNPSKKLKLVGVTGTNGKTTIATLLYELAVLMGFKAGLLSTVQNIVAGKAEPAFNTELTD